MPDALPCCAGQTALITHGWHRWTRAQRCAVPLGAIGVLLGALRCFYYGCSDDRVVMLFVWSENEVPVCLHIRKLGLLFKIGKKQVVLFVHLYFIEKNFVKIVFHKAKSSNNPRILSQTSKETRKYSNLRI